MSPIAPHSVSVSRYGSAHGDGDALRTVVWVRGEHDISTRMHLSVVIAHAARLDDADIVVDLSGVAFMDASTVGALVGARNHLRSRSRSLSVQAPSPRARRVLDLCGLAHLAEEHPAHAQPPVAPALGTWVDVPARDRGHDSSQPPVAREVPSEAPARDGALEPAEPANLVRRYREPM